MQQLIDMLIMILLSFVIAMLGLHAIVHGIALGMALVIIGCLGMVLAAPLLHERK